MCIALREPERAIENRFTSPQVSSCCCCFTMPFAFHTRVRINKTNFILNAQQQTNVENEKAEISRANNVEVLEIH